MGISESCVTWFLRGPHQDRALVAHSCTCLSTHLCWLLSCILSHSPHPVLPGPPPNRPLAPPPCLRVYFWGSLFKTRYYGWEIILHSKCLGVITFHNVITFHCPQWLWKADWTGQQGDMPQPQSSQWWSPDLQHLGHWWETPTRHFHFGTWAEETKSR